jgi:hypothetical protein
MIHRFASIRRGLDHSGDEDWRGAVVECSGTEQGRASWTGVKNARARATVVASVLDSCLLAQSGGDLTVLSLSSSRWPARRPELRTERVEASFAHVLFSLVSRVPMSLYTTGTS